MATKKAAKGGAKKGAGKKGAAKKGGTTAAGGIQLKANERVRIDKASQTIAQSVQRALGAQQGPSRLRRPILIGIRINPVTREIEIINQLPG